MTRGLEKRGLLWGVLAVALLARLLALYQFWDVRELHFDERYYAQVGASIAAGMGHPGALRPPLYPTFIAGVLLVARDPMAVRGVQIALSLVTVLCVFQICLRRFGPRAACLSGLACALSPSLVHYSHFLWSESFTATLLGVFFWLVDAFDRSGRRRLLLAAGVVLGLMALTNEIWAYFSVCVAVWLAWRARWRWRPAAPALALLLLGCAATIAPWTARNARVLGGFVLISTNTWQPIAAGNLLPADRWFRGRLSAEEKSALHARIQGVPERERQAEWRRVAFERIRAEQPWWIVKKLLRGTAGLYAPNSQQTRFLRRGWVQPSRGGTWALIATDFAGFFATMLPGVLGLWLVPGGPLKPLAVAAILYVTGVHVVAVSFTRYAVPLLPLFALYVGPLLAGGVPWARVPRWKWTCAVACAAGFVAVPMLGGGLHYLNALWILASRQP